MKRYVRADAIDKRPSKSEIDDYVKLDNGKYMLRTEWVDLRKELKAVQSEMDKFSVGSKSPKYKELAARRAEIREAMGFVERAGSLRGDYANRRPSRVTSKNNSSYRGKYSI